MKRRLTSLLLVLTMILTLLPIQVFAAGTTRSANSFQDVKQDSWYYDAVQYVRANGLFYGTSKTTFEPGSYMTRGMFVTVLGRMAGVDPDDYTGPSGFSDVPEDAYYAPYVAWAARYGVTAGTGNGTFSPNDYINRQQMAAFFVRYFEAFGVDYKTGANVTTAPADLDSAAPWARDAILNLWREKLLSGDGGNFDPQSRATRAQAASVCYRTDQAVDTWYSEPGVPSTRVRINPATGLPYSESNRPNGGSGSSNSGSSGGSYGGGSGSGGSGGTTVTTYYMVTFALGTNQTGMALPNSGTYPANTQIGALPTPTAAEEGKVFLGWYYDAAMSSPAKESDVLTRDVTLYAKIGAGAAVREVDTPNYIAAQDLPADFQLKLSGSYQEGDLTIINVTANNANVTFTVENGVVKITGIEGVDKEDTTRPEFSGRWNPGDTYKAVLTDGSTAVFVNQSGVEQAQTIRTYNFTIARAEAKNLELDSGLKYIPKRDTSDMSENLEGLFRVSLEQGTDGQTKPVTKVTETGSFTYSGSETLAVGNTVAIYDNKDPRTGALTDSDHVAYVEITSVSGTTYNYKTADTEDVLFTPDVLPMNSNKKSAEGGNTLTLTEDDMTALRTDIAAMGLDANITVDKGDFIAFYEGSLSEQARDAGNKPEYGKITEVTKNESENTYTVTYESVSENEVLTAMDIYTKENKEIDLTDEQKKAIEDGIAQQAVESGFLDAAARELTALALETDGFRKLAEDFDLESYAITFADGTPAGPEDLSLMAGATAEITKKEIAPKVHIGNLDHFDKSNGIRIELVMNLTIEVTGTKGNKLTIELQAAFEQEVMLSVNASGGAIWKWKWIFPYIYDYRLNANIDVGTYTGIGITATAKTQGGDNDKFDWNMTTGNSAGDKIIDIGKQIKELMEEKDKFMGKDLVGGDDGDDDDDGGGVPISGGLAEKYAAMIEDAGEDTSWIEIFKYEIFAKEGSVDPFHILCYGISADFVVKANFYVTLGMTFEYGAAKRYNFSIMLFHKECTNETIDLETPHYRFTFYVMGTMGIKAGVEFEIGVGLFSLKLDSIGICAEAGAYAQMWGYFYYEAAWEQGQGKNSQYSGAMLIEIGAYLEISFKAQLFSSKKLTYQPTIYEHQWPILTVGEQENVFDFAEYDDNGKEIALEYPVRSATTLALPSALFSMQYLDLQSGETGGDMDENDKMQPGRNCDDETESHFEIAMSDSHYTYNPKTNTVTINPEGKVSLPDCTMTIRWKNGTLAFTSQPIGRVVTISWSDPVNARYIAFDSQGGSQARSIYSAPGDTIGSADWPAPVKTGYQFDGWYTAANGGTEYENPGTMPGFEPDRGVKGVTLYAHWTPRDDTKYTVEHYQEELNGTFKLKDTETQEGTTDALVSVTAKSYLHFTVRDRELTAANVSTKIAPDGSTVVKLYYTRDKYEVKFTYGSPAGMSEVPAAKTYTAKYEAKVYAPMLALKGYDFDRFDPAISGDDKAVTVTGNAAYTAQWTAREDTPYRVEHYAQQVSGEGYLLFSDGVENKTGKTGAAIQAVSLKKTDLTGFTYDHAGESSYAIAPDGSTVVRLYYDRVTSVLTLNPDGGTLSGEATMSLRFGAPITAGTPTKAGYTFAGWFYTRGGVEVRLKSGDTMPAEALTLTAKWTARGDIAYKVEHYCQDADSGNYTLRETESLAGATGSEVTATARTYEHYRQNTTASGTVASGTISADGSLTLRLYYDLDTVTMTFDPNGGTIADSETTKVFRYGQSFSAPEVTRTGYGLTGWFNGETEYNSATKVTAAVTLTAQWTEGQVNYKVEHCLMDVNGSYPGAATYTDNGTGKTGSAIDIEAAKRTYEGFTFDHAGAASYTVAGDGSTVVKLYYTRNRYTLTWELNGGTPSGSYTQAGQVYYGAAITKPTVTKTGHTPAWSEVPAIMPAGDVTGTVTWTVNTRKVTFNPNGGSGTAQEVTFTYGQTNTAPTFTRTGYTLKGWGTSDTSTTAVDLDTLVDTETTDVILYAIWQADEYTITYVLDGGSNAANAPTTYTIEGGVALVEPTRTGYKFLGWTGTGITNGPIKSYTIPANTTGPLTFTAKWEAATYQVTFVLNGGTMTGPNPATYTSGTAHTLPTPTRESYRFMGWYDTASFDKQVTQIEASNAQDMTLYAKWEAKVPVTLTYQLAVTGIDGFGDVVDEAASGLGTVYAGDPLPTPVLKKPGYAGWYADSELKTPITEVPASDSTIYLAYLPETITELKELKYLEQPLDADYTVTLGSGFTLTSSWESVEFKCSHVTLDCKSKTIAFAGARTQIFSYVYGNIKDLNISLNQATTGNFGLLAREIKSGALIENVHVGGGTVTWTEQLGLPEFGCIAGENYGTIQDCTVGDSGNPLRLNIEYASTAHDPAVGGIMGLGGGTVRYTKDSNNYIVINRGTKGSIPSVAGGLVGGSTNGGTRIEFTAGEHHIYVKLSEESSVYMATVMCKGRYEVSINNATTVTIHSNSQRHCGFVTMMKDWYTGKGTGSWVDDYNPS